MSRHLRIATWNIHATVGLDRRRRPQRIAAVLDAIDADIIALQEVPLGAAMRELLEREGGYQLIAAPTIWHRGEPFGNALLARLSVTRQTLLDLSVARREPRIAISAELADADGWSLHIVATHFGLRGQERQAQLHMVEKVFAATGNLPSIIVGDFNETRVASRRLHTLGQHRALIAPATFPAVLPLLPLDRMLASADLDLRNLHAWRGAGAWLASDHLPLVAEIHRPGR